VNNIIKISNVKIHRIDLNNAICEIERFINSKGKHQVCVTNVYSLVLMQKDEDFRRVNNSSSLVVADGMPLVWVSKLYGHSIPERVSGFDIFYGLCKVASKKQYKFFFLGSTIEVLNKMCLNLRKCFPNLRIVGTYSPPFKKEFSEEENSKMIEEINKTQPDILWVGMTAPKQEKWIWKHKDELEVPVSIGIGAVFNFIAETVKRAPRWMQRCGLEWLFRLYQEPRRLWKRYLIGNTIFLWLVLKEFIKIRILRRQD